MWQEVVLKVDGEMQWVTGGIIEENYENVQKTIDEVSGLDGTAAAIKSPACSLLPDMLETQYITLKITSWCC